MEEEKKTEQNSAVDIDEELGKVEMMSEDFYREMEQSEDHFETICFCISKGYLGGLWPGYCNLLFCREEECLKRLGNMILVRLKLWELVIV